CFGGAIAGHLLTPRASHPPGTADDSRRSSVAAFGTPAGYCRRRTLGCGGERPNWPGAGRLFPPVLPFGNRRLRKQFSFQLDHLAAALLVDRRFRGRNAP